MLPFFVDTISEFLGIALYIPQRLLVRPLDNARQKVVHIAFYHHAIWSFGVDFASPAFAVRLLTQGLEIAFNVSALSLTVLGCGLLSNFS